MISIILTTLGNRTEEIKRLLTSLEQQTFKEFELIVVSQDNHEHVKSLLLNVPFTYKHISMDEKGLSRGRNKGINVAEGSVITFSDDDCWYLHNSLEIVQDRFNKDKMDIACFQIFDPVSQVPYKNYPSEIQENVTGRQVFKKSSIEIFIKVKGNIPLFDEEFGLGSTYPSGEENIYLNDLITKGYKANYYPEVIVYHLKPSVKTRLTKEQFIGKGPLFKRMYNTPVAIGLLTAFFLKKKANLEDPFKLYFLSMKELIKYKKR